MTKKTREYGCLSKTLDKFLQMSEKEQKKIYKNNTAKYYERIVKKTNASFKDHTTVLTKLPKEYRKKIDFMAHCDIVIAIAAKNEWYSDAPNRVLRETIQHLYNIQTDITYSSLSRLAKEDFTRVIDWLEYLKSLKRYK